MTHRLNAELVVLLGHSHVYERLLRGNCGTVLAGQQKAIFEDGGVGDTLTLTK